MKHTFLAAVIASGLLLAMPPANAGIITFTANLSGANEVPPNGSPATGTADLTLDDVADTLLVSLTFSGLTAPDTAGHIHCCAAAGTNSAVQIPFTGVPGFPVGVTSGTFSHTFDLNTDITGGLTTAAFITGLESAQAYVNIHNANFPGGEIRGQIEEVTPEPASAGLLLFGLMLTAMCGRRFRPVAR